MRSRYIYRHRRMSRHIGENVKWQPRRFPADPELIYIGDNVKLSGNVSFVNHDIASEMLNDKYRLCLFQKNQGCIRIGDNVMIGANVSIFCQTSIYQVVAL